MQFKILADCRAYVGQYQSPQSFQAGTLVTVSDTDALALSDMAGLVAGGFAAEFVPPATEEPKAAAPAPAPSRKAGK